MVAEANVQRVEANNLAGSYIPSFGEKNIPLDAIFDGQNVRANAEGGRFPRPGYEDTEIDLSSFNFTAGRGMLSAKIPSQIWIACDNGTNVKILYIDLAAKTVFDTGLSLTTGKFVHMIEWDGDIWYANGADTAGHITVGQFNVAVSSGDTTAELKPSQAGKFPSGAFTGRTEDDVFTSDGVVGVDITVVPSSGSNSFNSDHAAGAVVVVTSTLSPTYVDTASFLVEWLQSLNLAGDPDAPSTHEFGKFALITDKTRFFNFSGQPAGAEVVASGGKITGFLPTKNFFYTFLETAINFVARSSVDTTTGARIPQNLTERFGIPGPRAVTDMNGRAFFLTSNKRLMPINIVTEDGSQTVSPDPNFDSRVRSLLRMIDTPDESDFVTFNEEDQLAKAGFRIDGIRTFLVYDAELDIFYPPEQKPFSHMVVHETATYALDEGGMRLYKDEIGNFDHDAPIDSNWETGRIGNEFLRSALRFSYIPGRMSLGSTATVEFFKSGRFMYEKDIDDSYVTSTDPRDARNVGSGGVGSVGLASGGQGVSTFPFEFPVRHFKHGSDWKIRVRQSSEDGSFVQCDEITFGIEPRSKVPQRHA